MHTDSYHFRTPYTATVDNYARNALYFDEDVTTLISDLHTIKVVFVQPGHLSTLTGQLQPGPHPTLFVLHGYASNKLLPRVHNFTPERVANLLSTIRATDTIAFIEPHLLADFLAGGKALLDELGTRPKGLMLLVQRKQAPSDIRRYDGEVASLICSGTTWAEADLPLSSNVAGTLCYLLAERLLAGSTTVDTLLVRQLPVKQTRDVIDTAPPRGVVAIIPHRHPVNYLNVTLGFVSRMVWPATVRSAVGLDVEDVTPYLQMKSRPNVDLYRCTTTVPVGPYVFRQALIEAAPEELILLQDSDDIPCSDRVIALHRELVENCSDMVGCHELEVNEIERTIKAYRYPLDVSAIVNEQNTSGVSDSPAEPFLHATALLKRHKFESAGGFSTNRRIANDSQFFLRASFSMRISNVDAFLYVRRVHTRALTVAPETHYGSRLRKELSRSWAMDFKRIKRGELSLTLSSLEVERPPRRFDICHL